MAADRAALAAISRGCLSYIGIQSEEAFGGGISRYCIFGTVNGGGVDASRREIRREMSL